jgi:hypothetical protein
VGSISPFFFCRPKWSCREIQEARILRYRAFLEGQRLLPVLTFGHSDRFDGMIKHLPVEQWAQRYFSKRSNMI